MNASAPRSRMASQRGFSLSEMLVATAVFAFVVLAAYQVFTRSRESYMLGAATADMVQGARVAFEQMNGEIRLAGYEFDVDGIVAPYPSQPDEPLEFMHPRAIVVRGNLDFDKELRGRERRLENDDESALTTCCPVVTTANDEIVAYFLGKSSDPQPDGVIGFGADTTGTNEDAALVDTVIRDATVHDDGTVHDEEWVTIDRVNLLAPGDAGFSPPYTLYRAYIKDNPDDASLANGTAIERIPLVDNIYSLEFTFYDQSGNVVVGPSAVGVQENWGGTESNVEGNLEVEGSGGRAARWSVRQIKVKLVTLAPDKDLRLARANPTSIDHMGGKRKYTLEADIIPPNLGVRGTKDRDITPPEPPRNVEICSGECNMVRVSWDPGPPEDRVADHIVVLCLGECDESTPPLATKLVFANFDAVNLKEYAVLTWEDDSDIRDGREIWARVIARNVSGTESECPVDDCAECCATQSGVVVGTDSRIEAYTAGVGSGYLPTESNWPDARKDNVGGSPIVTAPTLGPPLNLPNPNYPRANELTVALTAPAYMLNVSSGDWTTKTDPGQSDPALSCYVEESTPADVSDDPNLRTPADVLPMDLPPTEYNTYVFRVAGNDSSNWAPTGTTVTDPRNFVPYAGNLHDFINLPGSGTYTDLSGYAWTDQGDQVMSNDLWNGATLADIDTSLFDPPVKAVTPGVVYYYRFRTVDICWKDVTTPSGAGSAPDGVRDDNPTQTAWMRRSDFASDGEWRDAAMHISPFYPPLLNEGDSAGIRDNPDPSVHDSDALAANTSPDTYAIPAYAIPELATDGTYIKPERPTEFYLAKMAEDRITPLDADGDGLTDARVVFNASRRNAPAGIDWPPQTAAYTRYRLYRKAAIANPPAVGEFDFDSASPYLEFTASGSLALRRLTLDSAAEGAPDPSLAANALLRDIGDVYSGGNPFIYWLTTLQTTELDDGIDTSSGEESEPSRPFLLPCAFYDQVDSVDVNINGANVQFTVEMHDDVTGALDCSTVKAARLIAYRSSDGDFVGSSDWIDAEDPGGSFCIPHQFGSDEVTQAKRGYGGSVSYVVELSDAAADKTLGMDDDPIGCRVRSDLLGESAVSGPQVIGCAAGCGTNGAPEILGSVDESAITLLSDPGYTNNVMRIEIPRLLTCSEDSFSLQQLEFRLTKSGVVDDIIPDFLSASIVGGLNGGGSLPLPALAPLELDEANEADVDGSDGAMVLRWFDSFCNGATCSYPLLAGSGDPGVNADSLVVELHFDGELCDVILEQFNFRVPFDDSGTIKQLLCSQRAGSDPDRPEDQVPVGASGAGRGPALSDEGDCNACPLTDCATCQCPLWDSDDGDIAMDGQPPVTLAAGAETGPDTVLEIDYLESPAGCESPFCAFVLDRLRIRLECDVPTDCANFLAFLPTIYDSVGQPLQLVHADSSTVALGPPNDLSDDADPDHREYRWNNLNIPIVAGETFTIVLGFDSPLDIANIAALDVTITGALPQVCDFASGAPGGSANEGSLCRAPSLPIPIP